MPAENKAHVGEVKGRVTPDEVREQLQLILASDPFKHSKRYQEFIRYVVDRTLEGRSTELKERTVGMDVFGREPHYDTAADPVVRIAAGEVRKRIAQYYDHRRSADGVRITLPSGSYIPRFSHDTVLLPESGANNGAAKPVLEPQARTKSTRWRRLHSLYWLAAVAAAFAAGVFLPKLSAHSRAIDRFWRPVCIQGSQVLVSVGEANQSYLLASIPSTSRESTALPTLQDVLVNNTVSWADAIATVRIASLVKASGCTFQLKRSESTLLPDLKNSPTILIGGFNNRWIMRLLSQQRYSYESNAATEQYGIKDNRHPGQLQWSVDFRQPPAQFHQDFGIVARFWDSTVERWIVVVSGMAAYGTLAASEFLTNPKYAELIEEHGPPHWQDKNMEIVFSTAIIDGNTGPPRITATYFW